MQSYETIQLSKTFYIISCKNCEKNHRIFYPFSSSRKSDNSVIFMIAESIGHL